MHFPSILRGKTSGKLFKEYIIALETEEHNCKPICRSVFLQIAETLTRGQINRKDAVDYVLGTLVYDNIRLLRHVVCKEISDQRHVKTLLTQLDAVEEFLKFVMLENIGIDGDPLYCAGIALNRAIPASVQIESTCDKCLAPFQVVENIKQSVIGSNNSAADALDDAAHKFLLYMHHQHRCFNQEKRIARAFEEVKSDPHSSMALLLIDYKMKLEPIRFREKTTELFGKKCIS